MFVLSIEFLCINVSARQIHLHVKSDSQNKQRATKTVFLFFITQDGCSSAKSFTNLVYILPIIHLVSVASKRT